MKGFLEKNKNDAKARLVTERNIYAVILLAFLCMSLIIAFMPKTNTTKNTEAPKVEKRVSVNGDVEKTEYFLEGVLQRYVQTTKSGNTVLTEYFDAEGMPKKQSSGNYALLQEKDEAGHDLETTYLGSEKRPVNTTGGYAVVTRTYNEEGDKESERYFDQDGEPVISNLGYHCVTYHYENGRMTMVTYLDEREQPISANSGYAIMRRTYYEEEPNAGKTAYEFYFDEKDNPVAVSKGQCGVHYEYNEKGKLAATTYLGADGKATMSSLGYATIRKTYNENGSLDTETYYDEKGEPTALSRGQYGQKRVDGKPVFLDRKGREMFALRNRLYRHLILVIVAALLIATLSLFLGKKGNVILLVPYLLCIAYMTLLYRGEGDSRSKLELFWSYRQFFSSSSMRVEIMNNIWLFLPLGTILFRLSHRRRVVIVALLLSAGIELLQYVTGLGLAEFDDVISNGLGGVLGTWLGYVVGEAFEGLHFKKGSGIQDAFIGKRV